MTVRNLVSDPGFENQKGGEVQLPWKVFRGRVVIENKGGTSFKGDNNVYIEEDGAFQEIYQVVPVERNRFYKLTAWIKVSPNMKKFRVDIFGVGEDGDMNKLDPIPNSRNMRAFGSNRNPHEVKLYMEDYNQSEIVFNSGDRENIAVAFCPVGAGQNPAGAWMRVDEVCLAETDEYSGELDTDDKNVSTESKETIVVDRNELDRFHHIILTWMEDPVRTQTISWETDTSTVRGFVQYAAKETFAGEGGFATAAAGLEAFEAEKENGSFHLFTVTLRDLKPGTRYLYRVGTETAGVK